jgi:hypothetical protein
VNAECLVAFAVIEGVVRRDRACGYKCSKSTTTVQHGIYILVTMRQNNGMMNKGIRAEAARGGIMKEVTT